MWKNVIPGLIAAAMLVFGASSASALALDANIAGIFTDSSFTTPVAGAVIDANGDEATVSLATGQGIIISIDVDNAPGDFITAIFATLSFDPSQLQFLGGAPAPSILVGGTALMPTSLANIGSGAIKSGSPFPGVPGFPMWVQALAYGSALGTTGTGPDIAAVRLFFLVTGAAGSETIIFDLGLTAGDAIDVPSMTFNSAVINVPEPGTALLMGLGLAGLAAVGRRKNQILRSGNSSARRHVQLGHIR